MADKDYQLSRLPKELRFIIVENALGNKPITDEENEDILYNSKVITLFYISVPSKQYYDNKCKVTTYYKFRNGWYVFAPSIIKHEAGKIFLLSILSRPRSTG